MKSSQSRLPQAVSAFREPAHLPPPRPYERILRVGAIALFVAGCAMGALGIHETTDIWISLATGRYILTEGHVPTTDPFSYTFAGMPFFNQNWFSHVIMYWVYDRIGPASVVVLTAAANLVIYGLILVATRMRSRSWFAALIAGGLVALACRQYLNPRPVTIGYTCLAATSALLHYFSVRSVSQHRWPALLLVPILLVWGNAHGSFIFGYAIIGIFIVCWALSRWIKWLKVAASASQIAAVAAATAVASIITLVFGPYGAENFTHPLVVGTSETFRAVAEWRPPWEPQQRGLPVWPYWSLLGLAAIAVPAAWQVGHRRRVPGESNEHSQSKAPVFTLFDLAVLGVGLYLSLMARRFGPVLYFVAAPGVTALIVRGVRSLGPLRRRLWQVALGSIAWLAAAAAGGWTVYRAAELLIAKYADQPPYDLLERFVMSERAPHEAMEFLHQNDFQPRVLCEWEVAGPILFAVPRAKVFIDGRSQQVYDEEHLLRYGALVRGYLDDDEAFAWLDETGTDAVLLRRRKRKVRDFLMSCSRSRKWRDTLCTPAYVLFLRADSPLLTQLIERERAGQLWWPDSPEALSSRGMLWVNMVPPDNHRALEYMKAAVERDPVVGLWSLGKMRIAFHRIGQREEAKSYFRALSERVDDPNLPMLAEDRRLLEEQLNRILGE